ncbi:HNH endonuclease signature motif containing protein [Actinoplanes campanulatus]
MFRNEHGKAVTAHRYSYESLIGPIPDGLTIDHLCRNRPCINPDHLEPVTQAENNRRVPVEVRRLSARVPRPPRTTCKHGHPLSGENLYVSPGGHRACRTCAKRRVLEFCARKRNQAQAA